MSRLPRELCILLHHRTRLSIELATLCRPPLARPSARRHSTVTAIQSVVEVAGPLADASLVGSATPWRTIGAAFVGLPLILWAYKCVMLVLFQRRIIYMGYLPPLARETKVNPQDRLLRGIDTQEVEIDSAKGITLRGIELRRTGQAATPDICLVYFQGNLGSPVQRLPLFSHLLLSKLSPFFRSSTVLLAIPPRSYYLSTDSSPSEAALLTDFQAVLHHAKLAYPHSKLVLYGHSLGATAACCLLGSVPSTSLPSDKPSSARLVDAIILENPFPSVRTMVEESLYPSKWLPYHYLSAFALDRWDALVALQPCRATGFLSELDRTPILFVSAEGDTLVKPKLVRRMFEAAAGAPAARHWLPIKDRSHDDAWMAKRDWGDGVRKFLIAAEVLKAETRPRARGP